MIDNEDVFVEQIVKRKFGAIDWLIILGSIFGVIIITYLALLFIPTEFVFIIFIAACVGAGYLIINRNLEFEYSITNGDITCDKIINRSRRKRQFSVDAKDVSQIIPFDPAKKPAVQKIFNTGKTSSGERGDWILIGNFAKIGNAGIIFSPDDRVLNAVKKGLPRQVKFDAFGRN